MFAWVRASAKTTMATTALLAATFAPALAQAAGTINAGEYVRLQVTLSIVASPKQMSFNFCPKQKLWDVDLQSILAGAKHVRLGVAISGPELDQIVLTPVAIDTSHSGFLGAARKCDVLIDQVVYLSPIVSVKRHSGQQFNVSPAYGVTTSANPAIAATIDAAVNAALKLSSVPAETAKPYQDTVNSLLAAVSIAHTETLPRHLLILATQDENATAVKWNAPGMVPGHRGAPGPDLVLMAQLVPVATLISDPANGQAWTTSSVLGSAFASNLTPGTNPSGTFAGYMDAYAATELANFRQATTIGTASAACDSLKGKVEQLGLSDRDAALLMWALTHDRVPAAITPDQIDAMHCLAEAWASTPAAVAQSRVTQPPKPVVLLSPPKTRDMQAVTQINDAFARFFVTAIWSDRRSWADVLFTYPVSYLDARSILLSTSTLANPDQWLALHTAETPIATKIGCYTYVEAASPDAKSLMYAVAEGPAAQQDKPKQVLLVATFANSAPGADAKITSLEVVDQIGADQKAQVQAINKGGQCASGYSPALIFGR